MTLNEIIKYAKLHNIDFDKPILTLADGEEKSTVCDSNVEQIGVKNIGGIDYLYMIPNTHSYDADLFETLNLCDVVNCF